MSTESGLGAAAPPPADRASADVLAPAFLRIRDVLRITALSRPTIYRRIAAHRFPPPTHLGGRACGWPSAALQTWIDDPEGYRAPQPADKVPGSRQGRP
jgi:predicted DNA-binding transcriptional regulator AlpA